MSILAANKPDFFISSMVKLCLVIKNDIPKLHSESSKLILLILPFCYILKNIFQGLN